MSQIDKIIYLPLLFWFISLFVFFYFIILSLFSLIILVTMKTRLFYLESLFNFSKNILIKTEYQVKQFNLINKINFYFNWNKLNKD